MIIKCAIIDDEPLALGLLKSYVKKTPSLELCGAYSSAIQAMELLTEHPVDLIFLDIQMPELDGIAAAKIISNEKLAPVLLLTAFSQKEIVDKAKESGVLAYLVKPVKEANLFPAMEIAVSRFAEFLQLENEFEDLKESLESRKILDRAKGILMEVHDLSESEAYRKIQQYSMAKRKSIKEVAQAIIDSINKKK